MGLKLFPVENITILIVLLGLKCIIIKFNKFGINSFFLINIVSNGFTVVSKYMLLYQISLVLCFLYHKYTML